jgi:hypothetical protein
MRWAGHVTHMGGKINICRVFEKTEGRRPLGRSRCRWRVSFKMDFTDIG